MAVMPILKWNRRLARELSAATVAEPGPGTLHGQHGHATPRPDSGMEESKKGKIQKTYERTHDVVENKGKQFWKPRCY